MTEISNPSLPPGASLVLDAGAIDRALRRIAHEILEANPDPSQFALIGIPTRGAVLSERLAQLVTQYHGVAPSTGVIDISMHRDDLDQRQIVMVRPTRLPDVLSGLTLILVDDVLFSGRTVRAAMDAISSFGRPARIQLAVLVDRGHRELPIRADYVGKNVPTNIEQRVVARFPDTDAVSEDAILLLS